MEKFSFASTPQIHFGIDKLNDLPQMANHYGTTILLVTGSSSFRNSKYYSDLTNNFMAIGLKINLITINKEPSPDIIDSAVNLFRSKQIDLVIAIGGGSVIDAGKAISAMLPEESSVLEYIEDVGTKIHSGKKVPFIAVPTTSGTGSEATKNAVLSRVGDNGFKKSLRHNNFVPDIALIDPKLMLTCPPSLTAVCGMDAFTQLLESYVSTNASEFTDSLAFSGLQHIIANLNPAYQSALNNDISSKEALKARSGVAYAALISGMTLANAGLGIVHGFASSIGGYFDIPHGVVCGTLMVACNALTIRTLLKENTDGIALKKYAKVGRLFIDANDNTNILKHEKIEFYCNTLITKLAVMQNKLEMPKLSAYGISQGDIEKIVAATSQKNNPIKLTDKDMRQIIANRI